MSAVSRISVVIISKNEESLVTTLGALKDQCADAGAECVVVDASGGRLSHVRDEHAWVRWHDYVAPVSRQVTIPHQRNVGVRIAEGDIIAFCDTGGIPSEGWLSNLTSPMLRGSVAATGGPIRSLRRSAYGTLNDLPSGAAVTMVRTSNLAFTRELFERVGGFDERFDYGSDNDFGWRIEEAGELVVSVPEAVMTIDWGDRRRQTRRDWHYGEAKARQLLLRPGQRRRILRESPEVIVYPMVFATAPVAVLIALLTRRRMLLAPWLVSIALLYVRDRRCDRPHGAMLDHAVVSIGICREFASAGLGRAKRSRGAAGL